MTIADFEEISGYPLRPADIERLLELQNECSFIWGTRDHWPVGVIMSYVWRDGRFWLTASEQRKRIAAVQRDERVSIVVSSTGTELGPNRAVTVKGRCILHRDRETKDWFYPALAARLVPGSPDWQARLREMLDSPRRVILEVEPRKWITYDGTRLMADAMRARPRPPGPGG
jgi:hypothetical protein